MASLEPNQVTNKYFSASERMSFCNNIKIGIIGAGISGLMCAYKLSYDGFDITIFDKSGFPGKGASHVASGMINPGGELLDLPYSFINCSIESVVFWNNFSKKHNCILQTKGSLFLSQSFQQSKINKFQNILKSTDIEFQTFDRKQLKYLEPDISSKFTDAIFFPKDINLSAPNSQKIIIQHLIKCGAKLKREMVTPITIKDQFDWVIDARGWEADYNDLLCIKGETILIENHDIKLTRPVRFWYENNIYYIVPCGKGRFIIGATSRIEEDANPRKARIIGLKLLIEVANAFSNRFESSHLLKLNNGIRPSFKNKTPKISYNGNAFHINGMYRHGFLFSPIAAEIIRDKILNRDNANSCLFESNFNHS